MVRWFFRQLFAAIAGWIVGFACLDANINLLEVGGIVVALALPIVLLTRWPS